MEDNLTKFMAGFTAFRQKKIAKDCTDCLLTFTQFREEVGSGFEFMKTKEIYGGYSYPSNEMASLICRVEKAMQDCFHDNNLEENIFIKVIKYLKIENSDKVGCIEHKDEITKKIIKFYLTMRMFFVTQEKNREVEEKRNLKKQFNKQAKLV